VLRGVVGGGFVWSGDLGCYVGGRAKPLESMGGKGFLGMPPAKGVPRRFLEMQKKSMAPPPPAATTQQDTGGAATSAAEGGQQGTEAVKMEDVVVT
jgi:vacuolar protein sorting-associated protein 72